MIQETLSQIENRLIEKLRSNPVLYDPLNVDPTKRGLTSPSQVAAWRNFLNVVATEIFLTQQTMNLFQTEIETLIESAAAGTNSWLQRRVLEFQYSATSPQVIQFNPTNFAAQYEVVFPNLRIVTQCAVVNTGYGGYIVKVATNKTSLSAPQLNALTSYLNQLNFGVPYTIINAASDYLKLGAQIYYDGQYAGNISEIVTAAINAYLDDFNSNNFNGKIVISKLEDILQAVDGVVDVVLTSVEARPNATAVIDATKLVVSSQELLPDYLTYAGYIIIDTTAGRTLADTLNFIVAS